MHTQVTAETAYDMVSVGPPVRRGDGDGSGRHHHRRGEKRRRRRVRRVQQPQDIREGVVSAYNLVRDGIEDTVHQIIDRTAVEHDQKGYTGALGAVIREIPCTIVRPVVLVTQATTNVLGGVKNQLVPDALGEAKDKWKTDDNDED